MERSPGTPSFPEVTVPRGLGRLCPGRPGSRPADGYIAVLDPLGVSPAYRRNRHPGTAGPPLTEQVLGSAPASACGLPDNSACYAISARLTDRGSFTPFIGSLAPNQGDVHAGQTITGATSGQWGGSAQWAEFFSPVLPNATLVPGSESGAIHPSSQWPDLMFPAGTQLTGGGNETYNYVYTEFGGKTNQQQWVDANFDNDGQSQPSQADFQGQITG